MTPFVRHLPALLIALLLGSSAMVAASHLPHTTPPPGSQCIGGYNPSTQLNICYRDSLTTPTFSDTTWANLGCYYIIGNIPGCVLVPGKAPSWPDQPAVWVQNSAACGNPTTNAVCVNGDSTFVVNYLFSWLA